VLCQTVLLLLTLIDHIDPKLPSIITFWVFFISFEWANLVPSDLIYR